VLCGKKGKYGTNIEGRRQNDKLMIERFSTSSCFVVPYIDAEAINCFARK